MRKTTRAIFIWTIFMVLFSVVVTTPEGDSLGVLAAKYAPHILVWFIGFVLLSVLWLRTVPRNRPVGHQ